MMLLLVLELLSVLFALLVGLLTYVHLATLRRCEGIFFIVLRTWVVPAVERVLRQVVLSECLAHVADAVRALLLI